MKSLDVKVQELGPDNAGALAELAWCELVEEADKELPLLVIEEGSAKQGQEVQNYLHGLNK